jgi:hypothetical protein
MTAVLSQPRGYGKTRLSAGIEAIVRALDDVRNGTLVCPCDECKARRESDPLN